MSIIQQAGQRSQKGVEGDHIYICLLTDCIPTSDCSDKFTSSQLAICEVHVLSVLMNLHHHSYM